MLLIRTNRRKPCEPIEQEVVEVAAQTPLGADEEVDGPALPEPPCAGRVKCQNISGGHFNPLHHSMLGR